jgi:type II secretory pathway component PulK
MKSRRMQNTQTSSRESFLDSFGTTESATRARRLHDGQEGVALMVVLLFLVLLSVVVVEFAYEMQVEASLAVSVNRDFEAYVAAKSAVASGLGLLRADMIADDIMNSVQNGTSNAIQSYNNSTKTQSNSQTQAQTQTGEAEQYDAMTDVWAEGVPYQALNDSVMQCTISDEYGKINLNALITSDGQENEALVEALRTLFTNLGFEKDPTDAILDWLDSDDDERPDGAETGTYESLETPYTAKNGQMDSIEELLLVAGIPAEVYFDALYYIRGDDMDSSDKNKDEDGEEEESVSLADLLTVHGEPSGAVNVNTARPEVLEALLGAAGQQNGSSIDDILAARTEEPFKSVQDFLSRAGVSGLNNQTNANNSNSSSTKNPKEKAGAKADDSSDSTSSGSSSTTGKTPNVATNPNLLANQAQGGFCVRSDVFRIWGDGRKDDVLVRIEAFVFRMGYQDQQMMNNGTTNNASSTDTNKDSDSTNKSKSMEKAKGKTDGKTSGSGSSSHSSSNSSSSGKKNKNKSSGKDEFGLKTTGEAESFRFLDWRVIR